MIKSKLSTLFVVTSCFGFSTAGFALDDGWYHAKEAKDANIECQQGLTESVLFIESNKPISISFPDGNTGQIVNPSQIDKVHRKMMATNIGGQGHVEIYITDGKFINFNFIDGSICNGAKVIFSK